MTNLHLLNSLVQDHSLESRKRLAEMLSNRECWESIYKGALNINVMYAPDIAQDWILKIIEKGLPSNPFFKSQKQLNNFLKTAGYNAARNWYRTKKSETQKGEGYESWLMRQPIEVEQIENDSIILSSSIKMSNCVEKLPPKQKEVVTYFYYKGLSCEEIAKKMQTNISAITTNLGKARTNIRKFFEKSEPVKSLSQKP